MRGEQSGGHDSVISCNDLTARRAVAKVYGAVAAALEGGVAVPFAAVITVLTLEVPGLSNRQDVTGSKWTAGPRLILVLTAVLGRGFCRLYA